MSIFNPDSKFMLYVRTLGDMIILNVLFVLFSLPVVTMGAAQAGLYTGLRELFDRDSNNSSSKSFFKGFKNGFVKITCIWTVMLAILAALLYSIYYLYHGIEQKVITTNVPIIVAIIAFIIFAALISQLTIFHSQFDCKPGLLIKNVIVMSIMFPFRNLTITLLNWLPLGLLIYDAAYTFVRFSPLWFGFYFAFAGYLTITLMKKPYEKIIYPDGKPEDKEDQDDDEDEEEEQ